MQEQVDRINPPTLAMLEGLLGAILGLALALVVFVQITAFGSVLTDSLLQGLLLGLGASAFSLIAVPVIYFVVGAGLGLVHAQIFNAIMLATGRLNLDKKAAEVEPVDAFEGMDPASGYEEPVFRGRPAMTFGERIPTAEERTKRSSAK